MNIFLSSTVATIFTAIITFAHQNWFRKKQNRYQDAKNNLPILLEILEDLNILEQAYIFNGRFCPQLEHRCPNLSNKDGDNSSNMSYAQRGYQFQLIGYKIIRNCRKVFFSTPKNHLLQTLRVCREIEDFLCSKATSDSKTHLDKNIVTFIGSLSANDIYGNLEIKKFAEKLHQLYDYLRAAIEKELPLLSE